MINDILTADEYKAMKAQYTADADNLAEANERLKKEVEDVLSCKHERMAWIEYFKEFSNLGGLNRRTVIGLIRHIKVLGKNDIEIAFNYQDEYETALAVIREGA